jgi:predicted amidohydrolase
MTVRVAAVQLASTTDRDRNLAVAERLVQSAAADGARLVVLPETFNVLGDHETMRRATETLDGPTLTRSRRPRLAAESRYSGSQRDFAGPE